MRLSTHMAIGALVVGPLFTAAAWLVGEPATWRTWVVAAGTYSGAVLAGKVGEIIEIRYMLNHVEGDAHE